MKLRILVAGLVFGIAALAADTGAELFQKAVTQERAAGNLEEAIKLYQRVAKEFASDRALAAKALVQAARCYEKLGQDKAIKIYEQVARDYRDQREFAAAASARLAVLRRVDRDAAPATMAARKIELPGLTLAATDGQRVLYRDDATGALMIGDLAGRDKRVIFKPKAGGQLGFMPSRDFSMVLLGLIRPDGSAMDVAVIKTDATGYREIGRLETFSSMPSWSWDNRYVLYGERLPDGSSRLLRITVADGQRLEVLRRETIVLGSASFSPDSRFIAFSEGPTGSSKVFVLPSHGGEPRLVSGDGTLVDWTRDGRYLAINSGTPDSRALYLLPVKDGQAAGEPVFIRNGSIEYGTTTATGSLLYLATPPVGAVSLGTLDPDGRLVSWKRLSLMSGTDRYPHPSWSPDSSRIAYRALNIEGGHRTYVVRLRNLASGEDRELYRAGAASPVCVWARQHANLYCGETETGASTTQILSVALDSGRVERLASLPGFVTVHSPSPDDSALYLDVFGKAGLVKWEIATHQETAVGEGRGVSRDERWVWGGESPREPQSDPAPRYTLQVRPFSGADWRRVAYLRMVPPNVPGHVAFTPDGNWLYFHDGDSAGKDALFRAPTSGGEPQRVGDFPSHSISGGILISPDGRKIIVNAPDPNANLPEQWLLENFEPKAQAAR